MRPRVTVLLAVRDGLPFVRECIASVLSQTFADFELLLVDDASADETIAVADSFRDRRIRVLRNERNLGQIPSLNRGLRHAQGEYVARIDHDDLCLPQRLARQVELLDAQPEVALCGTWVDVVDEEGRLWTPVRGHIRTYVEFLEGVLINRYPFAHPTIMFRRDLVLSLGGYDETLAAAEDLDLYRRLALVRRDIRVLEEPLVLYRRHGGQMSQASWALVKDADAEGLERVLSELSPGIPARAVRLLLTGESAYWRAPSIEAPLVLTTLIADARTHLDLSEAEAAELERRLCGRVLRHTVWGWRAAVTPWWRFSPQLMQWAAVRAPGRAASNLAAYTVVYPIAPVLHIANRAQRALAKRFAHAHALGPIRTRLRRSRTLRRVYGRMLGSS